MNGSSVKSYLCGGLETVKLDELCVHPENPKEHTEEQVQQIAASIAKYGWTQPIVVDENNVILIGHGRARAAEHLKQETVQVVRRTGLTEAQKRALVAVDNQLAQQTPMDALKLEALYRKLEEDEWPMGDFGFEMTLQDAAEDYGELGVDDVDGSIKQIVILFGEEYDEVIKAYAEIAEAKPGLRDNTEIFMATLEHYEKVAVRPE